MKSGVGQYFTPRPIIKGMVEVMQFEPGDEICDPACGTGGFFLSAHTTISPITTISPRIRKTNFNTIRSEDGRSSITPLGFNLYLHGIDGEESPITVNDSLISDPGERFDMVLTNPPFGKKSSYTVLADDGSTSTEKQTYERDDFWTTTSNRQLNFLQDITTLLKINGKAAVVVLDNVLFEGGSGETIRQRLLDDFNLHTILRLPTGIFYAQGVKANILFFYNGPASEDAHTDAVWYYDLRTNNHFTLKRNPLTYDDLEDFIEYYKSGNREDREESERFKKYEYEELIERDKVNLDIFWLEDGSIQNAENLPEPEVLVDDITENLQAALDQFRQIQDDLAD